MRLTLHYTCFAVAALVAAMVVAASPARATPQFAVVGQSLASQPAEAQAHKVTYYYRHGWNRPHVSYWYHRPYRPFVYNGWGWRGNPWYYNRQRYHHGHQGNPWRRW